MRKRAGIALINLIWIMIVVSMLTGCGNRENNYIINVSYDPTRELYESYNQLFTLHWKETTGKDIEIIQSHGGSGKQALEVANGLEADIVTLALEADITSIENAGLINPGFVEEFACDSSPYTSTIIFLVRQGNPKEIKDWDDLLREDVGVITPNPKTSGGARWNYLAAWYYFETRGESEETILKDMKTLYSHVKVLDSGARASTTSFVENGQGDVLLAWENEAFLTLQEYPGQYEIVIPSVSILCQPTVAIVDEMVEKHNTEAVVTEYLRYLYSDEAQKLVGENFYRPTNGEITKQFILKSKNRTITDVPTDGKWLIDNIDLTDINHFGGWDKTTEIHFATDGYFDGIYE